MVLINVIDNRLYSIKLATRNAISMDTNKNTLYHKKVGEADPETSNIGH